MLTVINEIYQIQRNLCVWNMKIGLLEKLSTNLTHTNDVLSPNVSLVSTTEQGSEADNAVSPHYTLQTYYWSWRRIRNKILQNYNSFFKIRTCNEI